MIYTASYKQPQNHHGELISISRTVPRGVSVNGSIPFLAPSQGLLEFWKATKDEQQYIDRYRQEISRHWGGIDSDTAIANWLRGLSPRIDQTLLCWEKSGDFCHRNLAIKFVQKYRPDCYGGMDIPL